MTILDDNPPERIDLRSLDLLPSDPQPEDVPRRPTVRVEIDPYTGEFKSRLVAEPAVVELAAEGRHGGSVRENVPSSSPKRGTAADPVGRGPWRPTTAPADRRGQRHAR